MSCWVSSIVSYFKVNDTNSIAAHPVGIPTANLFLRGDFRGWSIPIQIVSLLLGMGTAIPVRHLRVDVMLHQRFTYTALSHLDGQCRIELKKSISCALS